MRFHAAALLCLLAIGCVTTPEVTPDKSALVGVVTARAHSEVLAKRAQDEQFIPQYDRSGIILDSSVVDYRNLDEIYVGLVSSASKPQKIHDITFLKRQTKPRSLAIALGDTIRIHNATALPLTFFLAGTDSEVFQDIGVIPAGGTHPARVTIEGRLELTTDEKQRVKAYVLARRGLSAVRVASGGEYAFKDQTPGEYGLVFWHWRLGALERSVRLEAGKVSSIDEIISVDRTVR